MFIELTMNNDSKLTVRKENIISFWEDKYNRTGVMLDNKKGNESILVKMPSYEEVKEQLGMIPDSKKII